MDTHYMAVLVLCMTYHCMSGSSNNGATLVLHFNLLITNAYCNLLPKRL